jgi:hypothetical protein
MDIDGDGGRREFGLRGQRRGTESDKGTAANSPLRISRSGLKRIVACLRPGSRNNEARCKTPLRALESQRARSSPLSRQCPNRPSDEGQATSASTAFDRWSSSSNDMPRDGFASNSASQRRASAIPSSSSCRTDGSEPSRCAAKTALSVSGKSSASFSTSAMVAIGGSLVSTASKARTHQKTST